MSVKSYSGSIVNKDFKTPGSVVSVGGSSTNCDFVDCAVVSIGGSCTNGDFKRVATVSIGGSCTNCDFKGCKKVLITGSATNCDFTRMNREDIKISGSIVGCTLDGSDLGGRGGSSVQAVRGGGNAKITIGGKKLKTQDMRDMSLRVTSTGSSTIINGVATLYGRGTVNGIDVEAGTYFMKQGVLYKDLGDGLYLKYVDGDWVVSE